MAREMDFVDECYADKDLSLLKKLTLVIPTYNRNYYLSRCLWYHAHFPFGQIIVADSSPEEKKVVNRDTVARMREMFGADILYLEYEPETERYGGDIYRKWGDAVMHVETEYSQICTDKELLIPITMIKCIEILSNNPEYVFADGYHYNIEQGQNKIYYYSILPSVSSDAEQSIERFFEMVNNPGCSLLSLFRTTHIKCIYMSYLKSEVGDLRFGELYLELLSTILGKSYFVSDSIHTYRDTIAFSNSKNEQKNRESSTYRYPKIWDYPRDYYNKCYSSFKDGINNALNKSTQQMLSDDIDRYLNTYIIKRLGKPHPLKKIRALRAIYDLFPKNIQLYLLKILFQNHNGTMDYNLKVIPENKVAVLIIKIINEYNLIFNLSKTV